MLPEAIDRRERMPKVPSPLASTVRALAVAQARKRARLVPRRLRLPSKVGASGRPETTPFSSPRLPPGRPSRRSSTWRRSSERTSEKRRSLTASPPTLPWSMAKVAREFPSAGSRSRMATASGTMLPSGPVVSVAPAMRSRSSHRDDRCISRARAPRQSAFRSPVMSWGRPFCSKESDRSDSVAPAGLALRLAFRSKAGSKSGLPALPFRASRFWTCAPPCGRADQSPAIGSRAVNSPATLGFPIGSATRPSRVYVEPASALRSVALKRTAPSGSGFAVAILTSRAARALPKVPRNR